MIPVHSPQFTSQTVFPPEELSLFLTGAFIFRSAGKVLSFRKSLFISWCRQGWERNLDGPVYVQGLSRPQLTGARLCEFKQLSSCQVLQFFTLKQNIPSGMTGRTESTAFQAENLSSWHPPEAMWYSTRKVWLPSRKCKFLVALLSCSLQSHGALNICTSEPLLCIPSPEWVKMDGRVLHHRQLAFWQMLSRHGESEI